MPMVGISGKSRLRMIGLCTGTPHGLEPLLGSTSLGQYVALCIVE
jgi:hypothetical protein